MTGEWRWNQDNKNPIVNCAIGLEFTRPFTPQEIDAVGELYQDLKQDLPRRLPQFSFLVQPQSPVGVAVPRSLGGFVFDVVKSNGEQLHALSVVNNQIFFTTTKYDSWGDTWKLAEKLFGVVLPSVLSGNTIAKLHINYIDRFYFSGSAEEANISDLLKKSCFFAENAFGCESYWHSHHGFFVSSDSGNILENINISVLDKEGASSTQKNRTVDISTMLRLDLANQVNENDDFHKKIASDFATVHDLNKKILSKILHDEVLNRIPNLVEGKPDA